MPSISGKFLPLTVLAGLLAAGPVAAGTCGELISIAAHGHTTMKYAYAPAAAGSGKGAALVLLVGGPGFLNLDKDGCPHELAANSLVRSMPLFQRAGFATALVDAPSDFQGEDGLESFRLDRRHADDLAKLMAELRARGHAPVWIVGTSRGSISAANAAARLTGAAAPDGVILTSALMTGTDYGYKTWTADTVFDVALESIRIPVLVIGHTEDKCLRSPPDKMERITARTEGSREQVVRVTGGEKSTGVASLAACKARLPHGFIGQEQEVVDGMARFIRGGSY